MRCRRRPVEASAEVDELTEWGGNEIQRECVRVLVSGEAVCVVMLSHSGGLWCGPAGRGPAGRMY